MARAPAAFKQADVVRALRAARAAGVEIGKVLVARDGTITIIVAGTEQPAAQNDLDRELEEFQARHSQN